MRPHRTSYRQIGQDVQARLDIGAGVDAAREPRARISCRAATCRYAQLAALLALRWQPSIDRAQRLKTASAGLAATAPLTYFSSPA